MTTPDPLAASKNAPATASAAPGGAANVRATTVEAANEWWQQLDQRIYQCIKLWVEQWWEPQRHVVIDAVGQVFGEHRASVRETITNLKERVIRLETTSNFEDHFTRFAHEVKRGSEIPQGELLEKIEALQRQVDEFKMAADLDARFRELAERVGELEKTNSLEARFTRLADEAKGGPEIQQSELLARIEGLQRQLDELKKVAAQPGPQGPQGPPGKLPCVKEYLAERVHYEADVVTHAGALWQARGDTVHAPPHSDWVCLARAGRDAITPNVRGTYNVHEDYKMLDIVALDGASFVATRDNPKICPGDGWQLLSRQGRPGRRGGAGERGMRGEHGEKGETGPSIVSWQIDRERYRASPLMSDGTVGPTLELRPLFETFLLEATS